MQKQISEGMRHRGRQGSWQYPDAALTRAGVPESRNGSTGTGQRRRGHALADTGQEGQLTTALAWFSIGLGLAQLLMPRTVAKLSGLPAGPAIMRVLGARDMTLAFGLINSRNAPAWQWARVAGDAMDLVALGIAARTDPARKPRLAKTALLLAGMAALDVIAGNRVTRASGAGGWPRTVTTA